MREIRSRSYYCPKIGQVVVLIEYTRNPCGHQIISGILQCSEQAGCVQVGPDGKAVHPWGTCPACLEKRG